jgi:hypothetical protein
MGVLFSCPAHDYDPLGEPATSSGGGAREPPLGSGKLLIEGSLSFKRRAAGGDRDLHQDRRRRAVAGGRQGALRRRRIGGGREPQAPGGGAQAAEGVQELPHATAARRLRRPRRGELVGCGSSLILGCRLGSAAAAAL